MKRGAFFFGLAMVLAASSTSRAQEPAIPVPDTIRVEGVPPIPAAVGKALNRYQNIRSASFQDWASDGSGMYIITRFANVPQVHFVAQAGGARTQLTFLPERVLSVSARPKHDQFLYSIDEGGAENYQLFVQNRRGGEARRITDGKSRNTGAKWSPSGELLAWSSNARNGRDMDLYVAAPGDPHFVRRFKEVSGSWTVSDWSPDETKVVAVESISINESYLHIIEVATGKTQTLTPLPNDPKTSRAFSGDAKWSKNGNAIYYITDQKSEFRQLVVYYPASGDSSALPDPFPLTGETHWNVEGFDMSDDGDVVAFVVNREGVSILSVYRRARGMLEDQRELFVSNGVITHLAFRPGSQEVGFTDSSTQSDSDCWSIVTTANPLKHFKDGEARRWTLSETGGLESENFAEPQLIGYPSFDGRRIPAFVYRPSPRKFPGPHPVLIDIHGGPEGQFRPAFLGRLNYWIDELGLVVIFPNVRGSSGYGKSYLKLDNGKLRGDAVKDIGALFDWIAKQKDLDKSRVGVTGGSYGGFMSLAVQANYNDKIKCGIDIVGISNFVTFLKNTQGYRRNLRRAEYGDERDPEMRAYLEKVSPLANAGKIRTPILVVQGQNDPRVPISEAEQMIAALKKNGIPVWYVVGTNEGHGFAKKANQDYLQAVEVEFLRRYLLGPGGQRGEEVGERFPVKGTVTFKGEPLAEGRIEFRPTEPGGRAATGMIRDGRFTLTTVEPNDGSFPGTYKVTIGSLDRNVKIPARYSNPDTTPLRCKIAAAQNTLDFELNED